MDGSHYLSNGINSTSSCFPSPSAFKPSRLSHTAAAIYQENTHEPRPPGTPDTPNFIYNMQSYQQLSQPDSRPGFNAMASCPYMSQHGYANSEPIMPHSITSASHPSSITLTPARNQGPPILRPIIPGGIISHQSHQSSVSPPYGPPPPVGSMTQGNMSEEQQPTLVVTSRGRRAILPSVSGRQAAAPADSNAKSSVVPIKAADGKFPCAYCTKTYLHVKHLKRHLLRHTGDRPYLCVLCQDTFARSDILKRHFYKCSIRRGNPTGASHLSHLQAHAKRYGQAQIARGMNNAGNMKFGFHSYQSRDGLALV